MLLVYKEILLLDSHDKIKLLTLGFYEKTFLHNDLCHDIHKRVLTTHGSLQHGITPLPIILFLGMLIIVLRSYLKIAKLHVSCSNLTGTKNINIL